MAIIIGNTTATPYLRPDWNQTNETKADYIKNKPTDYVVEQGTSGIWTYRKWNSGVVECWGVHTFTGEVNTVKGNIYVGEREFIALPTNLFAEKPMVSITSEVEADEGIILACTNEVSATGISVVPASTISYVNATVYYHIELKSK